MWSGPGGDVLAAGGFIATVGGQAAGNVGLWDGTTWSVLGSPAGTDGAVYALDSLDLGAGPMLFAGGQFDDAGGAPVAGAARWNGTEWKAMGVEQDGFDRAPTVLGDYDDGTGRRLVAGGTFARSGARTVKNLGCWNGESWEELGGGFDGSPSTRINALHTFQSGDEEILAVGGRFFAVGGVQAVHIARWNGSNWGAFGNGLGAEVRAIQAFDDGSQPLLYAAGDFFFPYPGIAAWNGVTQSWQDVGGGIGATGVIRSVTALTVFDDGSGDALYAGGRFTEAGTTVVDNIAKWDGVSWQAMPGGGLDLGGGGVATVSCFLEVDLPSVGGRKLLVAGSFDTAGGQPAAGLAFLDASGWSTLPPISANNPYIDSAAVFDDGSGPALFISGRFGVRGLRKWNGTSWEGVAGGIHSTSSGFPSASAMRVWDDGSGPALFAVGSFDMAGPHVSRHVAKYGRKNVGLDSPLPLELMR